MGLREKLEKSRHALADRLSRIFSGGALDEETMVAVEEILLGSDLGWELTEQVVEGLPSKCRKYDGDWKLALTDLLLDSFPVPPGRSCDSVKPEVVILVGVNGSGKTTTLARLAGMRMDRGEKVLLACADTFRAAAAEQIRYWGDVLGAPVLTQQPGSDPGAVAFDAVKRAMSRDFDSLIIDTAGRLPNRSGLMDELSKVHRVIGKAMPGAPHSVLLVLDATVGQNALAQAEHFSRAIPVTGLVITKLDGTAKGGSVMAMAHGLGIPIEFIGTGESIGDLCSFDQRRFIEALLDVEGGD
jgi:fused signal recognition particle receptor